MRRLAQSTTARVVLKVFLASDHISAATGKTVAVTLSKNGGAFANPSAGATNATEIASGWYYVDLSTTDTGTLGVLVVRGTSATCDDAEQLFDVVNAFTGGLTALPAVVAGASGGLPLGDASARVDVGKWLGTAAAAPTVAGVPEVDVTYVNGSAAAPASVPTAAEITDAVWDEALAGHLTVGSTGEALDGAGGGGGTVYGEDGAIEFTYTVFDVGGVDPIPGAAVYVSSDLAGTLRSSNKITDDLGRVVFMLDAGAAYFWTSHPDYTFSNPDTEAVS